MLNFIILVFIGGAFGAMCRELIMASTPSLSDGFPMDIFIANIVAAFLLGLATSLSKKNKINQYVWWVPALWAGFRPSPALFLEQQRL